MPRQNDSHVAVLKQSQEGNFAENAKYTQPSIMRLKITDIRS